MHYQAFDPNVSSAIDPASSRAPLVGFAEWNSGRVLSHLAYAWATKRPLLLMNPAAVELPAVLALLTDIGLVRDDERAIWTAGADAPILRDLPTGFAVILMTSGTTGRPKLVALDEQTVRFNVSTLSAQLGLDSDVDVVLGHVPVFHAFGLTLCFMQALLGRAAYRFVPRFDRASFIAEATMLARTRQRVFLPLVPAMIPALCSLDVAGLRGVSVIGGDRLLPHHAELLGLALPLVDHTVGYGSTEAGPVLCHTRRGAALVASSVGRELPGIALRPKPEGTWEFLSEGQAAAFWDAASNRWRPTRGEWIDTGDILDRDPNGALRFVDRASWRLKRRGETVYAGLVESAIMEAVQGVASVVVVQGVDGRVIAVVEGTARDLARAQAGANRLPAIYRPDHFVLLETLPRNALGKVARADLLRRVAA